LPAPRLATPQLYTLSVHRCKVCSPWGPLDEGLGPVLAVHNLLGCLLLLVPKDTDLLGAVKGHLITAVRVAEPPSQMLLLLERLNLRRMVLLVDATLLAVAVDVSKLVHGHDVLLVEGGAVKLFDGRNRLSGCAVLDKSISVVPQSA
jgi:hypothetical protein